MVPFDAIGVLDVAGRRIFPPHGGPEVLAQT
jgi:hypothetical protein